MAGSWFKVSGVRARQLSTLLCLKVFDEFIVDFGESEFTLKSIDSSHVAMMKAVMRWSWFDIYSGLGDRGAAVLGDAEKVFSLASKGWVQLEWQDEWAVVSGSDGVLKRTVKVPFVDVSELPDPSLEEAAKFCFARKKFRRLIREMERSDFSVRFEWDGEVFKVSGYGGDSESIEAELEDGDGVMIYGGGSRFKAYFSTKILYKLLGVDVDYVDMVFHGDSKPLKIVAELDGDGEAWYWLAPRIEDEDE